VCVCARAQQRLEERNNKEGVGRRGALKTWGVWERPANNARQTNNVRGATGSGMMIMIVYMEADGFVFILT